MSDHLKPEYLFEFIDQGGSSGPAGHHLMDCPECLFELDFILLAEVPAAPEDEAALAEIPVATWEVLKDALETASRKR